MRNQIYGKTGNKKVQLVSRIKPVLQHVRFTVTGSIFFFLIGNQIYSADITLRIKVVISNLKQFATQRSCLTLSFSPYKVLKVSELFMLTYQSGN